jgi:hypothetical protein
MDSKEINEYKGKWWLPKNPENKIPGTLKIDSFNELFLEIEGSFDNDDESEMDFRPEIILGESNQDKKEITLEECMIFFKVDHYHSKFFIQKAFIGKHFFNPKDIKFQEISVRYHNLDNWTASKYIWIDSELSNSKKSVYCINHNEPETISAKDFDISFSPIINQKLELNKLEISQKSFVKIESRENEKTFLEFTNLIRKFQDFLSFAIGRRTFPIEVCGISRKTDNQTWDVEVDIYYSANGWDRDEKTIHPIQMVFKFNDIKEQLSDIICHWLDNYDTISSFLNLYFSTIYKPDAYLENKFLSMTQAIETYHRNKFVGKTIDGKFYEGKYQSDEEYKNNLYQEFLNAIPTNISHDFRESLKSGKLKYANEYSLRTRIRELIEYLENRNIPLLFAPTKTEYTKFINKVVDTRNYLTHYTKELEQKAALGNNLLKLTFRVQGFIELLILIEMGFDYIQVLNFIGDNQRLRFLLYSDDNL